MAGVIGILSTGDEVASDERGQLVQAVRQDDPTDLAGGDGQAAPHQLDELGWHRVVLRGPYRDGEYVAPVRDTALRGLLEQLVITNRAVLLQLQHLADLLTASVVDEADVESDTGRE